MRPELTIGKYLKIDFRNPPWAGSSKNDKGVYRIPDQWRVKTTVRIVRVLSNGIEVLMPFGISTGKRLVYTLFVPFEFWEI